MRHFSILRGDVLDRLRSLPAGAVRTIVTSPPYWGLRSYGTTPVVWGGDLEHAHEFTAADIGPSTRSASDAYRTRDSRRRDRASVIPEPAAGSSCACGAWLGELGTEPTIDLYVEHVVDVFREARRVLANDGTLWLNLGDSYAGGGGFAPNAPANKQRARGESWGSLNPARMNRHEAKEKPSAARKPPDGLKPKDLCGVPWRVAFALQADGWFLRSEIIWHKPNPMPESVLDRPTRAHETIFLLSNERRYFYNAAAISEPVLYGDHPRNGAPGPPIQAPGQAVQAGITARRRGGNRERVTDEEVGARWDMPNGRRNKRDVWSISTQPFPEAHFAVMPEALVEPCILAGSERGDVVLDPFAGAGTVGVVALRHEREFLGIELSESYVEIARNRILSDSPLFNRERAFAERAEVAR